MPTLTPPIRQAAALLLLAAATHASAHAASLTTLANFDAGSWSMQGQTAAYNGGVIGTAAATSTANLISPPASGTAWTSSIIYRFTGAGGEGAYPDDGLVMNAGVAYGATSGGGNSGCANGCGTLFALTPPASGTGSWTETQIYKFNADQNGFQPRMLPIVAGKKIYGTAVAASNDTTRPGDSGSSGGVAFQLAYTAKTGWQYTLLHHFDAASLDGTQPSGAMVRDGAGNLYGETFLGGQCGYGVVYELSPPAAAGGSWSYRKLHDFGATATGCDYNDGRQPVSGLTLAGNTIFGTTSAGSGKECGTAYKITLGATPAYSRIYTFGLSSGDACSVQARLRVLPSGVILGTSAQGGSAPASTECAFGCGTVFSLTPQADGSYTGAVLYSFTGGTDGSEPRSPLLPVKGGFFGLTSHGGMAGDTANPDYASFGTAFRIKP